MDLQISLLVNLLTTIRKKKMKIVAITLDFQKMGKYDVNEALFKINKILARYQLNKYIVCPDYDENTQIHKAITT